MARVLLLLLIVPLLDLAVLVWLGRSFGFWPTVTFTFVTGVIGAALAKRGGLRVWREFRVALEHMKPPERGVLDGALVLVGAVLLMLPGILSDVAGLLLLIPITRAWLARPIKRAVDRRLQTGQLSVMNAAWSGQEGPQGVWRGPRAGEVVVTDGESVGDDAAATPAPPRLKERN